MRGIANGFREVDANPANLLISPHGTPSRFHASHLLFSSEALLPALLGAKFSGDPSIGEGP